MCYYSFNFRLMGFDIFNYNYHWLVDFDNKSFNSLNKQISHDTSLRTSKDNCYKNSKPIKLHFFWKKYKDGWVRLRVEQGIEGWGRELEMTKALLVLIVLYFTQKR